MRTEGGAADSAEQRMRTLEVEY